MVAALLLPFNRPATAKIVVDALLKNPPSRLYIGADGPRANNDHDKKACAEVREILLSVDWPCDVFTLFRDENLGATRAITSHIDWFFSHEEHGVILEDDCIPNAVFLRFCEALLTYYEHNPRVMSISGFTPLPDEPHPDTSYRFSIFCLSWGWATWRRAWKQFRPTLEGLDDFLAGGAFPGAAQRPDIAARWTERFRTAESLPGVHWFIQWTYSCWVNNGVSVMPYANLVRNLGSLDGGKQAPGQTALDGDRKFGALDWPLRHPESLIPDDALDIAFMREFYELR